ncbi:hypothetical protein ACF09H_19215, partial [Streptomyces sp. NPDC014983]
MDPSLVDAMMPSLTAAVTAYGANVLVRAEDAAAVETVRLGQRLVMARPSRYPLELRRRAVRMVAEVRGDYPNET